MVRADARQNRLRLLDAAAEMMAENDGTITVAEVSRRAGVGPGTLFRHFRSRQELTEAVYREQLTLLADDAESALGDGDAGEALLRTVRRAIDACERKDVAIRALERSGQDHRVAAAGEGARFRAALNKLVTRAIEKQRIRPDWSIDLTIAIIVAAAHAILGRTLTPAEREVLIDSIVGSIGAS